MDYKAVPGRVDIRDAGVMTFVVQPGRCDSAIAVLQRRKTRRLCRVRPASFSLELRARAIPSVQSQHASLLFCRVRLHWIFNRAGWSLGVGRARQHRGHPNRGDEPSSSEELPPRYSQREHALLARAVFKGGYRLCLRLRDGLTEAAERLFGRSHRHSRPLRVGRTRHSPRYVANC